MRFAMFAALAATVFVAGCNQQPAPVKEASIDQANLCEVKDWMHGPVAESCNPGQKVVFLPNSWGNEQLPVIFAAVNCDMRYQVVMTNGGVTCIYGPITPKAAAADNSKPAPAAPAKQ